MKENSIKLGPAETSATSLENLLCPFCHETVVWNKFYSAVDKMQFLLEEGTSVGMFTCPHCGRKMTVLLDVLVYTEKNESAC